MFPGYASAALGSALTQIAAAKEKKPKMIALVYAGNNMEYRHFIHENNLHQNQYLFISKEYLFAAVGGIQRGTPVILYGTYRERYDYREAMAVFDAREFEVIEWDEVSGEHEKRKKWEEMYGKIHPRTAKYALKRLIEEGTRPHVFEKFLLNQPQEGI